MSLLESIGKGAAWKMFQHSVFFRATPEWEREIQRAWADYGKSVHMQAEFCWHLGFCGMLDTKPLLSKLHPIHTQHRMTSKCLLGSWLFHKSQFTLILKLKERQREREILVTIQYIILCYIILCYIMLLLLLYHYMYYLKFKKCRKVCVMDRLRQWGLQDGSRGVTDFVAFFFKYRHLSCMRSNIR